MQGADDLQLLCDAARSAGEIARHYFETSVETWDKADNAGPVTQADLEIDRMLKKELLSARPSYGWLSEETDDRPENRNQDRVFIVDPIDGTRSFIAGEKHFAHSLAIVEHGEVIEGVVYLPLLDRLYMARRNTEATCNGEPIRTSSRAEFDGAEILAAKPNFDPKFWSPSPPPSKRVFRPSLAYRMCLIAEGRFDAMITLRDCWEWDIAAGSLIASCAGATVTDRQNSSLRFNSPRAKTDGVVAAGPDLHEALLHRLKPACD